ncbi:MAG: radical SAM protein [Bacteroides sp.]|nr:radical SAM protein [Prevotella sp.]MCM1407491.1 radical SAM protein [Treponema brennaborense]MCM1469981.1 radical SAM protein [Bacteroides sp.]
MFLPTEIIFAPTSECNLRCAHCFTRRHGRQLDSKTAIQFLKSCVRESGGQIQRIGFSGGEPFLRPEFIAELSAEAAEQDLLFDRLMTNGDFWQTEAELRGKLQMITNAGFDGKFGLSFDCFHNQPEERIFTFIETVFGVCGQKDRIDILSAVPAQGKKEKQEEHLRFQTQLQNIAEKFGGTISGKINRKTGCGTVLVSNKNTGLYMPVFRFSQSLHASPQHPWNDRRWFKDDFCEYTGQTLYVHADGTVAPCCGFANEEKALCIGTIHDPYSQVMENAQRNRIVKLCYETGLNAYRKKSEKRGVRFPGKTADMCMFCGWLCRENL